MHTPNLGIPSLSEAVLPLLDPAEVPDLPQPARLSRPEPIVACPVTSMPVRGRRGAFAIDGAVIAAATLLASAGLLAASPGAAPDLPAPLADFGFALSGLAFSVAAPLGPLLPALLVCSLALAVVSGRAAARRFAEANAPHRLVVGPPREVRRFVGGDRPLSDVTPLAAPAPRAAGAEDTRDAAADLPALVLARPTDEVVLLRGWTDRERCEQTFRDCQAVGVDVAVEMEDDAPRTPHGARIERRGGRAFARYTFVPRPGLARGLKWALEYAAALMLTLAALPLMALIALAVKLSSPGPVIYRQMRTGLNGRRIPCFKFRTMVDGAHAAQGNLAAVNEIRGSRLLFKMDNDPRVTRVGQFLRRTSLDELPQLFNVLRGELTLIGPRLLSIPLGQYRPAHRRRLSVRPGIACVWQAWHRGETDFEAWMRSDLDYLDRWSLLRDFRILMRTAWVVLRREGAR